ncbi:fumarylacetoacetate hydrolase family protein, partial [Staphylococcus haemolyticus]
AATLHTRVNGQTMQEHSIGDLLFTPAHLVAYFSTMLPLNPGDIILTGTPGGVGRARNPQVFLKSGDVVEVKNGYARNYLLPRGFATVWT